MNLHRDLLTNKDRRHINIFIGYRTDAKTELLYVYTLICFLSFNYSCNNTFICLFNILIDRKFLTVFVLIKITTSCYYYRIIECFEGEYVIFLKKSEHRLRILDL